MERDWLIMTHWLTRSWSLRSSTIHHVQTETWGRKWGTPWGWSYNSIQVLKPENQGSWWWCKSQPKGRRPIYWSVRQAKRKLMLFLTHGGGWSTFSSPPIQMLVHKETQPKMTPETKFNLGSSWLVKLTHKINLCRHVCVLSYFSHVWLCATLWTVARQAPLAMGFSRQEYWSGLPFPSLGDLPDTGIEPVTPAFAGRFFTTEPPGKPSMSLQWLSILNLILLTNFVVLDLHLLPILQKNILKPIPDILSFLPYISMYLLYIYIFNVSSTVIAYEIMTNSVTF